MNPNKTGICVIFILLSITVLSAFAYNAGQSATSNYNCKNKPLVMKDNLLHTEKHYFMAALGIREILSRCHGDHCQYVYRIIKGYAEIYPYVLLEKIQRFVHEEDDSVLQKAWSLRDLEGVPSEGIFSEGSDIKDVRWEKDTLVFAYISPGKKEKRCKINGIFQDMPKVVCAQQ